MIFHPHGIIHTLDIHLDINGPVITESLLMNMLYKLYKSTGKMYISMFHTNSLEMRRLMLKSYILFDNRNFRMISDEVAATTPCSFYELSPLDTSSLMGININ